jgi:hypothetical protein
MRKRHIAFEKNIVLLFNERFKLLVRYVVVKERIFVPLSPVVTQNRSASHSMTIAIAEVSSHPWPHGIDSQTFANLSLGP